MLLAACDSSLFLCLVHGAAAHCAVEINEVAVEIRAVNAGEFGLAADGYFATFQVESGDRMELQMNGQDYGMLVEGDRGRLTFQGTRYLDFQRM